MTEDGEEFTDTPSSADDVYVPVGLRGIMSATTKLLHMSRGLSGEDVRDGVQFKRILTPSALISERVRMDNGGVVRNIMRHAARHRSLKGFMPSALDGLTEHYVTSNGQLVSPIEEINPIDILGQSRRVTAMGPGGVGSKDSITENMQAVHGSQFGFFSTIEGPESEAAGIDVRLAHGVKIGDNGRPYQKFRNKRTGNFHWLSPEDLIGKTVGLPRPDSMSPAVS